MNNPFEIGPFPTIQEAGYARDRYTLALQGPSACLNNPIIDIIIGEDDTNMLLSAISMIENPQNGPEVELKPQHEAMACTRYGCFLYFLFLLIIFECQTSRNTRLCFIIAS